MYALRVFLFFVLYVQLFRDDIKYLLSMETLWKKRRPPNPLDFDNLPHTGKCLHLPCNLVYTGGQCSKNVYTCINISIIWMYHKNISLNLFGVFCEYKEKYCAMDTKLRWLRIIKLCTVKHSMCTNIHVCQCNVIQIDKVMTYVLLHCRLSFMP